MTDSFLESRVAKAGSRGVKIGVAVPSVVMLTSSYLTGAQVSFAGMIMSVVMLRADIGFAASVTFMRNVKVFSFGTKAILQVPFDVTTSILKSTIPGEIADYEDAIKANNCIAGAWDVFTMIKEELV